MAMYIIIHVEKGWIVCDGQTKLIRFDRKSVALRTAHDAEELLRTNEAAEHKTAKPIPTGKVGIDPMIRSESVESSSQARPHVARPPN
jgi:hypothetical protein